MSNVGISVIVPVYNAERYIKRCIESILSQTLKPKIDDKKKRPEKINLVQNEED